MEICYDQGYNDIDIIIIIYMLAASDNNQILLAIG